MNRWLEAPLVGWTRALLCTPLGRLALRVLEVAALLLGCGCGRAKLNLCPSASALPSSPLPCGWVTTREEEKRAPVPSVHPSSWERWRERRLLAAPLSPQARVLAGPVVPVLSARLCVAFLLLTGRSRFPLQWPLSPPCASPGAKEGCTGAFPGQVFVRSLRKAVFAAERHSAS